MLFELASLLYGVSKDIYNYNKYTEVTTVIDDRRFKQIQHEAQTRELNLKFRWSKEAKIPARRQDGWDYYYEIDKDKKTKAVLRQNTKDGAILIAKEDDSEV